MRYSSHSSTGEAKDFVQMPLDFVKENQYINAPLTEADQMQSELLEKLEKKISEIIEQYQLVKAENKRLVDENARLMAEKDGIKDRVDAILSRLEGI